MEHRQCCLLGVKHLGFLSCRASWPVGRATPPAGRFYLTSPHLLYYTAHSKWSLSCGIVSQDTVTPNSYLFSQAQQAFKGYTFLTKLFNRPHFFGVQCQAISFFDDLQSWIVRGGLWTCAMHMQVKPASVQTILARYYMRFIAFSWKLSFDLSRATSRPCTQIKSVNDDSSSRSMQVALHLWHKDQWEASQVPCLVVDMHWLHAVGHTLPWRRTSLWWWRGAQNTNTQFSMCPCLHSMLQGDLQFGKQQMWVRASAERWENML